MPVHEDCVRAVKDAVLLCESLGHSVEEAAPVIREEAAFTDAFLLKLSAGVASIVKRLIKLLGLTQEYFEPLTWGLYEQARAYDAADYLNAEQTIHQASRDIASFFEKVDIWLTPTVAQPPLPLGSFAPTPDNPLKGFERTKEFVPFTPICNVTGQPAMSVPLYWNADGLPIGAHFMGRFGDEATLFRLAAQLESARPWKDKRPSICA
jgi:amidase